MILILTRSDLVKEAENIPFEKIKYDHFRESYKPIIKAEMVVFFENAVNFKILKNRYPIEDKRTRELLKILAL